MIHKQIICVWWTSMLDTSPPPPITFLCSCVFNKNSRNTVFAHILGGGGKDSCVKGTGLLYHTGYWVQKMYLGCAVFWLTLCHPTVLNAFPETKQKKFWKWNSVWNVIKAHVLNVHIEWDLSSNVLWKLILVILLCSSYFQRLHTHLIGCFHSVPFLSSSQMFPAPLFSCTHDKADLPLA